jgi:hypothetical protein
VPPASGLWILATVEVSAVVMASSSLSGLRVLVRSTGEPLWSLSGIGDTHATYSVREMSPSKVTPTPPTY